MTVEPVRPQDVGKLKYQLLPEKVIETWNQMIAENSRNQRAIIKQKDILARLKKAMDVRTIPTAWIDIEDAYREFGWDVEYDDPGFNEVYEAEFIFSPLKVR